MAREKPIYRQAINTTTHDYETTRYNDDDDDSGGKKTDNTPLTLLDIDKKVR
jgi:hypothetical protein